MLQNYQYTWITKQDFNLYHRAGSQAPPVIDIIDGYATLKSHKLPTITKRVKEFILRNDDNTDNSDDDSIEKQNL